MFKKLFWENLVFKRETEGKREKGAGTGNKQELNSSETNCIGTLICPVLLPHSYDRYVVPSALQ
jgi:hypothetical protein